MINRVLIRTRVLQVAYAHYHRPDQKLNVAEAELKQSLERTYDLYLYLLQLPVELTDKMGELIEIRRGKRLATVEDLNPNTRILSNRLVEQIRLSDKLTQWYSTFPIAWRQEGELLRGWINLIESSSLYRSYNTKEATFEGDRDFWIDVFTQILFSDQDLAQYLESKSLYWDDATANIERIECEEYPGLEAVDMFVDSVKLTDQYVAQRFEFGSVEVVKDFVLKTLRRTTSDGVFADVLLENYRDPEDEVYAQHLLRQLLLSYDKQMPLIEQYISDGWERERLASLDLLIMQMAIVEFLHFPSIPTYVTINEYVELSKHYSTPKSSGFINGVLDSIARALKQEGKILKN